ADPDPFGVRTSWYERRKLGLVLGCLARPRYALAWDAACGTGDLALALSRRCRRVVATDRSPCAVALTTQLCADRPGTRVRRQVLPDNLPPGENPELVVLSEVLYYLSEQDRGRTYEVLQTCLSPATGTEVVAVHWRHRGHD